MIIIIIIIIAIVVLRQLQYNNKYNSKTTLQYIFTFCNNNQRDLKSLHLDQSPSALVVMMIIIIAMIIISHIYMWELLQQLQYNNKYTSKTTLQYILTFYNNNQRDLKSLHFDQWPSALVIIITTITIIHSYIYMVRAITTVAIQQQININNNIAIYIYFLDWQPKTPEFPWSGPVT